MKEPADISEQLKLMTAITENDNLVLRELYKENFHKVKTHVLTNNGTIPEAKDIYQEAFIAVWQNVKNGKFVPVNETALQGYLYQIARNKWTDHLRSNRYKKTTPLGDNITVKEEKTELPDEDGRDTLAASKAFKQLGEQCKKLLTHFYYEKRSLREIASIFNIGEASARNKKYRCINMLRELATASK